MRKGSEPLEPKQVWKYRVFVLFFIVLTSVWLLSSVKEEDFMVLPASDPQKGPLS